MDILTEQAITTQLVAGGLCGPHQSHSRRNVIAKIHSTLRGEGDDAFGLSNLGDCSPAQALAWLAELTGSSEDLANPAARHVIEPHLTYRALRIAAGRLQEAATTGATLLATTGHPTGLLEHHIRVADAYRAAGGKVMTLREDERLPFGAGRAEVRYVGSVGCLADGASLRHTHSAQAMENLLDDGERPDLVLADHGFAGAAIERGIPAIAVMDINDPALAIAWGQGRDVTVIPMDDNRLPRLYRPSWSLFEQVLGGRDML